MWPKYWACRYLWTCWYYVAVVLNTFLLCVNCTGHVINVGIMHVQLLDMVCTMSQLTIVLDMLVVVHVNCEQWLYSSTGLFNAIVLWYVAEYCYYLWLHVLQPFWQII